jgi:hypothetical protein
MLLLLPPICSMPGAAAAAGMLVGPEPKTLQTSAEWLD